MLQNYFMSHAYAHFQEIRSWKRYHLQYFFYLIIFFYCAIWVQIWAVLSNVKNAGVILNSFFYSKINLFTTCLVSWLHRLNAPSISFKLRRTMVINVFSDDYPLSNPQGMAKGVEISITQPLHHIFQNANCLNCWSSSGSLQKYDV